MAKKKPADDTLTMTVAYGDVSIGEKTCRISVKVDRNTISITKADKTLCDKRLTGAIVRKPDGEAEDQGRLDGMEDVGIARMAGIFDVKGFSVSAKHIGFGMTFAIKSVDVGQLAKFAKRQGQLVIDSVAQIDNESNDAEDEE